MAIQNVSYSSASVALPPIASGKNLFLPSDPTTTGTFGSAVTSAPPPSTPSGNANSNSTPTVSAALTFAAPQPSSAPTSAPPQTAPAPTSQAPQTDASSSDQNSSSTTTDQNSGGSGGYTALANVGASTVRGSTLNVVT